MSDKCFAELGGTLGIDKILVTDIGEFGATLVVNMRIIDLSRAESKLRSSKVVANGVEGVLNAIPELLSGLGYTESAEDLEQKRQDELRLQQLQKDNLARAKAKGLMRQKAAQEKLEKQKAADSAIQEVENSNNKDDWGLKPWVRYGGITVAILGAGIVGSNNEKISDAKADAKNAVLKGDESAYVYAAADVEKANTGRNFGMGVLGLGAFSFVLSFEF